MKTYKLNKTAQGKKFLYTVTDENGNIISTRTSSRDYVACTIDGSFYFGRLDLINKGDHGRTLNSAHSVLNNPEKVYKDACNYLSPGYRQEWMKDNPFESWKIRRQKYAKETVESLSAIAYL